MHTIFLRYCTGFTLLVLSLVASADSKQQQIDQLMALSGMTKQVGEYPGLVKAGFAQSMSEAGTLPEEAVSAINTSIDQNLLPATILREVNNELSANLDQTEITELLAWFNSDQARLITIEEEQAATPEAYNAMLTNAQQLMSNQSRLAFAQRIDALIGATDMTYSLQESSSIAIYTAMMTALAPDAEIDLRTYRAQLAAVEPQAKASIQQFVLLSMVYTYRNLDDNILSQYETFLGSPIGQKFNTLVTQGLIKGLNSATTNWAAELAQIVKNQPKDPFGH